MTSNCCKIIAQSRCCQYIVIFLIELSSNQCLNFLKKTIFSVHTNLYIIHLNLVKASYYPLFMTSMLVFIQNPTLEVRANILDIFKPFDKVWQEELLFKTGGIAIERIRISGNLLSLLKSFLNNRFRRVVLNGQCLNWSSVLAGVPQGQS